MIKLILFDFDDTLCMTEEDCFLIENETAKKMGHAPMDHETHKKTWGMMFETAVQLRLPGIDTARFLENVQEIQAHRVAQGEMDVVKPAYLDVLTRLRASGKEAGILTSRSYAQFKHVLSPDHVLHNHISAMYYLEITQHFKPDPRVFDKPLEEFDIKPSELLYVGDSLIDAEAAHSAGAQFIATLESGLQSKESFEEIGVQHFVQSLDNVDEAVYQIDQVDQETS